MNLCPPPPRPRKIKCKLSPLTLQSSGLYSQFVFLGDAARRSVSTVVSVLQVNERFSDQVVHTHQVPVVDLSNKTKKFAAEIQRCAKSNARVLKTTACVCVCVCVVYLNCEARLHGERGFDLEALPEDRVELFGDVVLLVVDGRFAESDDDVGIRLPVQIRRMQVVGLK